MIVRALAIVLTPVAVVAILVTLVARTTDGEGLRSRAAENEGLRSRAAGDDQALCMMTFNLRYASDEKPNAWPERRPVMKELLERERPDVIGTQEGLYAQLKDMAADLPAYAWIGEGREGGSQGEFMAVFYRKERLEPLEFHHFWLSDTPEVIASSTWGNACVRMVTWVRFEDRATKKRFCFFDTHFDHKSEDSRRKSARLVLQRVNDMNTKIPVLLVGDFNSPAGDSEAYSTLVNENAFTDTWTSAEKRGEAFATWHDYKPPQKNGQRIDWILSRGAVETLETTIVTWSKDGQLASDHFPVVARLRL